MTLVKSTLHTRLNTISPLFSLMNEAQHTILAKLRYQSFLSYNQLWDKQGDSSKFAYHLKSLIDKHYVQKTENGYSLTLEGIKFTDYLTLKSPQPLTVVIVVAKKGNSVLYTRRSKYPFKGYGEFCSSKVEIHETLEEAARDRLHNKLGLRGPVTYKGIEFLQTKENNELVMHHHLHIFLADAEGEPPAGEWIPIDTFSPEKPMPHLDQTLRIALHDGFSIAFSDLIKEGDAFTSYTTHSFKQFKN